MKNYILKVQLDEADEQKLREHFIGAQADDSIADILTICIESGSEDMFIVSSIEEKIPSTFINDELEDLYTSMSLASFAHKKTVKIEKEILNNGRESFNLFIIDHEQGIEEEEQIIYDTLHDVEADMQTLLKLYPMIKTEGEYIHYKFDNGELADDIAKNFFEPAKQYDATIIAKPDDGRRGKTWIIQIVSEDDFEKDYEYYSEEAAIADCEELVTRCDNVNES